MVRLAHEAIEAGCSNEETYVLLEERDSVWGKFVGRTDRAKRLQGIIAKVRSTKVVVAEITGGTPQVYRFNDFMKTDIKLEWAIEGLQPVAGSLIIFGRPGIGKSTLSLRLAICLALGIDEFLIWKIVKQQRVMFISLEMQHYELKEFFGDMNLTEEQMIQLQEWFFIWPIGAAYPLDTPDQQSELLKYIDRHKIQQIIIDSHSLAMYGSVTNDDDVKRINSFLNEDVRRDRKCGYIFIHHPRKQSAENSGKEESQDDSFGSQYIAANAQTMMILTQRPGSKYLHINMVKRRHALGPQKFDIERTPDRGFKLVGSRDSKSNDGESTTDKKTNGGILGPLFKF